MSWERAWFGGSLVVLAALGAAALWAANTGERGAREPEFCRRQLDALERKRLEAVHERSAASERIRLLQVALTKDTSPHFEKARELLASEQSLLPNLEAKIANLEIQSVRKELPGLLFLLVVTLELCAGITWLLVAHARRARFPSAAIEGWQRPWMAIAAIAAVVGLLDRMYTTFFDAQRSWFGFNSYCVSHAAFASNCVLLIGVACVTAVPLAISWRLTAREHIPAIDPALRDCGVGRYVLYLQSWAILSVVATGATGILWIKYSMTAQAEFQKASLLLGSGALAIAIILIGRLIRNAIVLRLKYQDTSFAHNPPPPDPTAEFLGERWWSLPASLAAALGTLWAILEWFKIGDLIVGK